MAAINPSSLRHNLIFRTALLSMVFTLAVVSAASNTVITVKGQVRTSNGGVIRIGVVARLIAVDETPAASVQVDSDGNFEFDNVTPAIYTLEVTADGYKTYREPLDLSSFVKYFSVRVVLTPQSEPEFKTSDPPPLTDEAAPKPARKEFAKGDRAYREKKYAEARSHLEKAVAAYPCYARAETILAEVEIAQKEEADAETHLQKAVQCDGTFMNSYSTLAQLYYGQGQYAKGVEILERGLRLSPGSWLLHFQLGASYFAQQKYPASVKEFEAAESLHPDIPADFHVQIVNAYLKTGQNNKALTEIDTYLRLDPNGKYSTSGRKIAEILRNGGAVEASPTGSSIPSMP